MTEPHARNYERIQLPAGEPLFQYGDSSNTLYLLSNGSVDLRHNGTTIATVDERDHPIGTPGVVLKAPRQYTAVTTEDSRLKQYSLDREAFFLWLDERPLILVDIIKNYVQLMDHFNQSNENKFSLFRKYRTVVQDLIRPLSRLSTSTKELSRKAGASPPDQLVNLVADNPLEPLLTSYRKIVNTTGRSGEAELGDLDVPEETLETIEPGNVICSEGNAGENLYVLIKGSLSVYKGDQRVAVIDQHGSVFGEMSPALQDKRRATVQADTEAVISVIPYNQLESLLDESPDFSRKLLLIFFGRFQRAVRLNNQLTKFLRYVKTLLSDGGLSTELQSYLDDLGKVLRNSSLNDDNLQEVSEDFLEWLDQPDNGLGDQVPPEPLSDFTSKDISY